MQSDRRWTPSVGSAGSHEMHVEQLETWADGILSAATRTELFAD